MNAGIVITFFAVKESTASESDVSAFLWDTRAEFSITSFSSLETVRYARKRTLNSTGLFNFSIRITPQRLKKKKEKEEEEEEKEEKEKEEEKEEETERDEEMKKKEEEEE